MGTTGAEYLRKEEGARSPPRALHQLHDLKNPLESQVVGLVAPATSTPVLTRTPTPRHASNLRLPFLVTLALINPACSGSTSGNLSDACLALGACDAPAPTPASVQLLCDRSAGSTCTPEVLHEVVVDALEAVAPRPGSEIAVWMLGRDIESTSRIATATSTPPPRLPLLPRAVA